MFSWMRTLKDIFKDKDFVVIVLIIVGLMMVTSFSFIMSYRLALVGREEVAVPNVINKELSEALQDLQVKNLDFNIQLRFSEKASDLGHIIEQSPKPGFVLRAGRKVSLIVSKGALQGVIPNFIGRNIESVRDQLSLMYTKSRPLLVIANPMSVYDSSPVGTILSQDPQPGYEISSLTELKFRISRGPTNKKVVSLASNYVGLGYKEVLENLFQNRMKFEFFIDDSLSGDSGVILLQEPDESQIIPLEGMKFKIKPVKVEKGNIFRLLDFTLPLYPVDIKLDLEVRESENIITPLYSFYTRGGRITVPILLKEGSIVNVKVYGEIVDNLKF